MRKMVFVTLVGERWAEEGKEFAYLGIGEECSRCRLKGVCSNLKVGHTYRIKKVRDKKHQCKIHEGGVRAVEIEELPIVAAVRGEIFEGATVPYKKMNCDNRGCENFNYCHLLIKEKNYRVAELIEKIECPKGFNLKKVILED